MQNPPPEPAHPFDPTLDLVVVLETEDPIQLSLAKGLMEDADIPYFVLGQIATLVQDVDPFLHKRVRVQVPCDREAEARDLLEGMLPEEGAGEPGENAWRGPRCDTPGMVRGIEHTAIASLDPHKLARWYVEHLDFVVNFQSASNQTTFLKASDGSMIEIIEASGAPAPAAPDMKAAGLRHLALAVTDFDAVYERLKGKGVSFLTKPEKAGGNAVVFFTDCDGNILHLLQREKPLP